MDIRKYLKQSVAWQQRTGENAWGESTFAEPAALPARVRNAQSRILAPGGQEATSQANVMLIQEVKTGDLICPRDLIRESLTLEDLTPNDYWQVQTVEDVGPDVRGKVLGWTAFL